MLASCLKSRTRSIAGSPQPATTECVKAMRKRILQRPSKFRERNSKVDLPVLRRLLFLAESDPRNEFDINMAAGVHKAAVNYIRHGSDVRISTVVHLGAALGHELIWRKK